MAALLIAIALIALAGSAAASSELKVEVYEGPTECDGPNKAAAGDSLSVHYTGTIDPSSAAGTPGKQFDSSRVRGEPFDFVLGGGMVIRGWDEGFVGLCLGARANLVIPPDMGYGDRGAGADIPGGATLRFDVEVMGIDKPPPADDAGTSEPPPTEAAGTSEPPPGDAAGTGGSPPGDVTGAGGPPPGSKSSASPQAASGLVPALLFILVVLSQSSF